MRIPKDITLSAYINALIQNDRLIEFYKSDDWKELRSDVMEELHNECQDCLRFGLVTKADCVHHVNEVRCKPSLALSKYYTDKGGNKQRNLVPLCNACHNIRHPEKGGNKAKTERFRNVERW